MSRLYSNPFMIGSALAAAALLVLARLAPRFPGDLEAALFVQSIRSPALVAVMEGLSDVLEGWKTVVIVVVCAGAFWVRAGWREAAVLAAAGAVNVANGAFKILVDRPRPTADLVTVFAQESTASFPSGHAFFAVVVIGMLAYLIAIHQSRTWERRLTVGAASVLILWIGVARVYLGVHWPSDVIGGYLVGLPFLLGQIRLYQALRSIQRPAENQAKIERGRV
jgi:undecaprenyl-diphosphatase